ncbi:response regulator transcription factor [Parahaliea sp. F7430]|uniref:Response regulator transcription factor n=1 Tax=Sediminihaliea albiluteola TaxID=2758564 RepID=A0A7W2YK87_9GAMM|nr:response regulator transcription factor [Sediminihaliea albiluteola]MBA6414366.1 response regulator transcription factor [Sediminihaliea albiluteola]
MEQVFVTPSKLPRRRWEQAFGSCRVVAQVADAGPVKGQRQPILWLEIAGLDQSQREAYLLEAVAAGYQVAVMSAMPSEQEALACLNLGARAYCHVEAAPEQLREIHVVLSHGGLWMPPSLVQRLMSLSLRVVPTPTPEHPQLDELTSRELMVAEQVALGASNQEIAAALSISERTVKAHLSSIFSKLGVRDRVQLALAMNNIPTFTSVN